LTLGIILVFPDDYVKHLAEAFLKFRLAKQVVGCLAKFRMEIGKLNGEWPEEKKSRRVCQVAKQGNPQ
jgi:hypothetical protein